ncbi:hypothetical protein BC939DRAFT_294051 [Gamsiella multidivaricata]|uniref:uncharacterized protein n=1 Tax=Gamsiella multidivaricata TaxID=101098 RepID=UPI00222093CA|nr:uncharacterized protein BC939DRAFT_294051 [Gamsiella multidivaricata]KAI7818408.1 hypothetical protein BC939DRAFT_294051 [Gamsiella multidivaricata]
MADYKLVFALERYNCQDYVISTLADALTVGAVPIVDGPKDYSRFFPTKNPLVRLNSFISPQLLVRELDSLDKNDALYLERLHYKIVTTTRKTKISPSFREAFGRVRETRAVDKKSVVAWGPNRYSAYCGICRLAHDLS